MARKRARDPNSTDTRKRRKVTTPEENDSSDGGIFNADQLDWKAVQLPDRLDDAEGFYGLEEIDDVEILRGFGEGNVRFKVSAGYLEGRDGC